jgi:hypothetical protein
MPPFVPLADGVQVEIRFTLDGLVVENRLWFVTRQPPLTGLQMFDLASGVYTWHTGQVMPLLASELTLIGVRVTAWQHSGGFVVDFGSVGVPGGNTSGTHSANVSYRLRFRPTSNGYPLINSNFVPGIPKDGVNENTIASSFQTALRNAYINLIDLAAVFGPFPAWRWVVTSQVDAHSPRSEQLAFRLDFIQAPSIYISPRRRRISRLRRL